MKGISMLLYDCCFSHQSSKNECSNVVVQDHRHHPSRQCCCWSRPSTCIQYIGNCSSLINFRRYSIYRDKNSEYAQHWIIRTWDRLGWQKTMQKINRKKFAAKKYPIYGISFPGMYTTCSHHACVHSYQSNPHMYTTARMGTTTATDTLNCVCI